MGGRAPHFKDGALVTEPALLQGYPMAATAWSFKRETLTWEPANIDTKGLLLARTGMGAASRRNADGDTEVFFVGGEKRKATGIGFRDKTTAYVTRINLTTGAATALPNYVGDVSSPTVFFDQYGRLAVRQGVEWIRTDAEGWHYTPKRLFAALNVDDAKATWRERKPETATTEGAGAAAIPVIDAFVFGPVRMPDGTIGAEMYG